jgi:hypothetical protein
MPAYKSAPKLCPVVLEGGVSCGRPATVLDHARTGGSWPAVYICKWCFEREHPEMVPDKPEPPDIPVFGAQYIGGLYSKPNVNKSRKRWKQATP